MKLAYKFDPGPTTDHLQLDVIAEPTQRDERALKAMGGKLTVSFHTIPLDFKLFDTNLISGSSGFLTLTVEIELGKKWQLKHHLAHTVFLPADSRKAVVFVERVMTEIKCAMIMATPLASFQGIARTFDFDVAAPKEVVNFDHWRRSVLLRGS